MNLKKAPYELLTSPGDRISGMSLNPFNLRFTGESAALEQNFLNEYYLGSLQHGRVAIFMGALMMSAFGILDIVVLEESQATILAIRFGALVPAQLAFFLYTFTNHYFHRIQLAVTMMVLLTGFGLSAIVLVAPIDVSPMYFAGNMLVIFFAYAFLRLRFIWANTAGWFIVWGFFIADYLVGKAPFEEQFMRVFFTSSTCLLGMFVAYSSEYYARRNFFLRDVLEQQKSELEQNHDELEQRVLERTDQALAAVKAKSDFLANMSHEIRTPMNGVLGMLELLRDSKLSSDQKEKLNTASNSAESLLDVINDVLDLSKIEAGKMKIKRESVSPALIIEDIANLLAPQFQAKNLQLIHELEPEAYDSYLMDGTRLRQVILNLVGNALKFTDQGSVKVKCGVDNQILSIEIIDTGIGIMEEQRKVLFEAFSQADNSNTREFGGTGLGLSISKQLTELMNGSISVESRLAIGSTFSLSFPVESCSEGKQTIVSPDLHRKVFYIVESELHSRSVRLMLNRLGCEISRLSEADIAITDLDEIDCPGLPVLFLRQSGGGATEQNNSQSQYLRYPISLNALSNALQKKDKQAASGPSSTTEKRFSGKKVLLVEDNQINQKVASAMLSRLGTVVDIADCGKAALEKFSADQYDLILMDCQMPGMDGFETTGVIRQQEKDNTAEGSVIVALTANAMEGDRQRCLESGMNDYMSKPINLTGLVEILDRWVPSTR